MLMNKKEKLAKLTELDLSIPELEAYLAQRLNQVTPTPLTLVYLVDGKFIYEKQYNPAYKGRFIGFCTDNTIFYAQLFKCSLAPANLRLDKINGLQLNAICDYKFLPKTAYLATSREKNTVYKYQKEWSKTVRILIERHIKMYTVKKIGGNLFNDIDRGGLQIYCAATNEYHDIDGWRENGTMMICSGIV